VGTPLSEVVEGYTELASDLVGKWSEHASKVAAKLDAGTYDADQAVSDLGCGAVLATESVVAIASKALDAVAILTGRQFEPYEVESDSFFTTLPGAALAVAGPFTDLVGTASLPASAITVTPAQLDPAATEFQLHAIATGVRGATYFGIVEASASGQVEPVRAWIVVA
jgi:hypothetical protein